MCIFAFQIANCTPVKKKNIFILAVFMLLSIVGLIGVQLQYSYKLLTNNETNFDADVKSSLYQVSKTLEEEETMYYINEAYGKEINLSDSYQDSILSLLQPEGNEPVVKIGELSARQQRIVKENFARKKIMLTEAAMKWFNAAPQKPLKERIDINHVESLIEDQLEKNSINTPFKVVFIDNMGNIFSSDSIFAQEDSIINKSEWYSQILFTSDYGHRMNFMRVWFPEKKVYILKSLAPITILSCLSTLLIFSVFIAVIVLMNRDRKLTESKNDFMHNMTHELKTPISSISLASQMLNDDAVAKSDKMRKHLTSVISEETKRLTFQVEKVLQISLLESEKYVFKFRPLDVNSIITTVADNFEIKVIGSRGSLITDLQAKDSVAEVDEMHFTNVIYNLLDNAVKYSKENQPIELKVSTYNNPIRKNTISIDIEDNGIGIASDDVNLIFEKFQRVHTGNLHNVKGFGLGLAYVKNIVQKHNGTIDVASVLGVGTKFTITIPSKH